MILHHFNKHRTYTFLDYLEVALAFYYQYRVFGQLPQEVFGEQEKQSIFVTAVL